MSESANRGNRDVQHARIRKLTGIAMLTAIVVLLQLLGSFIRFGTFSVSLVLVPIVVGAALYGSLAGLWLGFVFGAVILLSGDANLFLAINIPGTLITVVPRAMCAGLFAGLVYRLLEKFNRYVAVVAAAIVCPITNTGLFLLGCRLFFWDTISQWAAGAGYASAGAYAILGLAGLNFVFELLLNCILSPVIVRLITLGERK